MQAKITSAIMAALVAFGLGASSASAQGHSGSFGHAHGGHGFAHDKLFPYVCDLTSELGTQDFNSQYVNDHGHLTLLVTVSEEGLGDFICDNAGGVADLARTTRLNTASAWVKTTGGLSNDNVYLEFIVDGVVFYFSTSEAKRGPSSHGYTYYTWNRSQLPGFSGQGVSSIGIGVTLADIGTASVQGFSVNGHELDKGLRTQFACPWNGEQTCDEPG